MANALITYPSENRVDDIVALTVDLGTEDTEYPILDGVQNVSPGRWGKFTGNTGGFVMDFGSAVAIPIFGIPLYHASAGATITIQANSSVSWGSPPLSATITVPAYRRNGFPHGIFKDLSGAAHTYRYWRLSIMAGSSVPVQFGWLWLAASKRNLVQNVRFGLVEKNEDPSIIHETDFLWETNYPFGTTRMSFVGELRTTIDDGAEEQYQDWTDDAGHTEFHLFSHFPESERCWLVRHSADYQLTRQYNDDTIPVSLLERAKGLRP